MSDDELLRGRNVARPALPLDQIGSSGSWKLLLSNGDAARGRTLTGASITLLLLSSGGSRNDAFSGDDDDDVGDSVSIDVVLDEKLGARAAALATWS